MAQQLIPAYSQEEIRRLRLQTCTQCIYSTCNGNSVNKCNVGDLVCSLDNNENIIQKTNDLQQNCPNGYWDYTNKTRPAVIARSGCGCGR